MILHYTFYASHRVLFSSQQLSSCTYEMAQFTLSKVCTRLCARWTVELGVHVLLEQMEKRFVGSLLHPLLLPCMDTALVYPTNKAPTFLRSTWEAISNKGDDGWEYPQFSNANSCFSRLSPSPLRKKDLGLPLLSSLLVFVPCASKSIFLRATLRSLFLLLY